MIQNAQKILDQTLETITRAGRVPNLLLHSCCAPCSSYTIEYLSKYFNTTVYYYNPNISPEEEFAKRAAEQRRLIRDMKTEYPVVYAEGEYEPEKFFAVAKGLEDAPEGGDRCMKCYRLRLEETAKRAASGGFDYFTTTLSISPLKNAAALNGIGAELGEKYGVPYLISDFKKRGGYQRSIELSKEYDLYRQNFCGCIYSRKMVN